MAEVANIPLWCNGQKPLTNAATTSSRPAHAEKVLQEPADGHGFPSRATLLSLTIMLATIVKVKSS